MVAAMTMRASLLETNMLQEFPGVLRDLGATPEMFEDAARRGVALYRMRSQLDVPTRAGFNAYAERILSLREALVHLGWKCDDEKNVGGIISPDNQHEILTTSGDENAGATSPSVTPQPKRKKGEATKFLVDNSSGWLPGFEPELKSLPGGRIIWLHLVSFDGRFICHCIGRPEQLEDGFVTRWIERYVFQTIDMNTPESNDPSPPASAAPIDFEISPKT